MRAQMGKVLLFTIKPQIDQQITIHIIFFRNHSHADKRRILCAQKVGKEDCTQNTNYPHSLNFIAPHSWTLMLNISFPEG